MTFRIMGIHMLLLMLLCFHAIYAAVGSPPSSSLKTPLTFIRVGKLQVASSSSRAFLPLLRGGSEEEEVKAEMEVEVEVEGEEVTPDAEVTVEDSDAKEEEKEEDIEVDSNSGTENSASSGDTEVDDGTMIAEVEAEKEESGNATEESKAQAVVDVTKLCFNVTQDGDGSESDPDGIPGRFLRMQKGNREKAKKSLQHTIQWREEHNINDILARPYPTFDLCKRVFPVYIPGRDKDDNVVVVQRVGLIDFELGHGYNMTTDDILNYYLYIVEYCWNVLESDPHAVMTTLLDLKGVKISTFRDRTQRTFMKQFVRTMSDHYPNRSHKTMIINAPSWAQMAYKVCKPLLRESTKKKISLWNGGKQQDEALIAVLGKDAVPKELLEFPDDVDDDDDNDDDGTSEGDGGGHEASTIELELRSFCMSVLEAHGVEMMTLEENE